VTSRQPEDDYRVRLYAEAYAAAESLLADIQRLEDRAPSFLPMLVKKLSAALDDARSQRKEVHARVLRTFDEDAKEKDRRFNQYVVEAAWLNSYRRFALGVSLAIVIIGYGLAIWILAAGQGAVSIASGGAVASLASGGGALVLARGIALGNRLGTTRPESASSDLEDGLASWRAAWGTPTDKDQPR
jgi:hypothetical protein